MFATVSCERLPGYEEEGDREKATSIYLRARLDWSHDRSLIILVKCYIFCWSHHYPDYDHVVTYLKMLSSILLFYSFRQIVDSDWVSCRRHRQFDSSHAIIFIRVQGVKLEKWIDEKGRWWWSGWREGVLLLLPSCFRCLTDSLSELTKRSRGGE